MGTTRDDLHRVAAHVLGRRRFGVSGHFGLRASPGGLATPAFGPEPEVLRLDGTTLVRETGTTAHCRHLVGASLAELAAFAGTDLASEFSAGPGMPVLGATDQPLELSADELEGISAWFDLGWRVLDAVLAGAPEGAARSTVQLWPEHFDVGTSLDLGAAGGGAVNLGFSAGDAFCDEPYVYVGPWGPERPEPPDEAGYWNAPFGAAVPRTAAGDAASCRAFIERGLRALAGG
ncbi:MAG TPA: hypothetical protein VHD39_05390 [Acidimicrobiales bacterium]|nr:hypothetical protein [Acidimicrobiales bacterium]